MAHEDDFVDTFVTVTGGPREGETGYCDDVEGRDAFVYFRRWRDGYEVISTKRLRPASRGDAMRYRRAYFDTFHTRPEDLGH